VTPLLAARRRAGDRAFERLYRNHVHAVYRYALAVLHNEADAEDVTQTAFLNAYRAFQRGERPHTPHNWLIKIAHNVCRQRFRDTSRRPREVEFDDSHAPATTENPDVPTATEIRRALGFLAFNQRAALVMRELEGRSYAEIADVLDVSVAAVETLMFRARRALREQLEGGLTCDEAENTLASLQKRKLSSADRGALRAHLRECRDCATLERRQRAQRAALDHLGAIPLPASLATFLGGGAGGGVAVGGFGVGAKVATVLAAGLLVTSVGHEPLKARATDVRTPAAKQHAIARAQSSPSTSTRAPRSDRIQRKKTGHAHARKTAHTTSHSAARTPTAEPAEAKPVVQPSAPSGGAQQPAAEPPPLHLRLPLPPPPPPIQLPGLPPIQVPPVQVPPLPPVLPPPPPLPLPLPLPH
jgi:RNA polymerase sigma factor (sigma-70 family)